MTRDHRSTAHPQITDNLLSVIIRSVITASPTHIFNMVPDLFILTGSTGCQCTAAATRQTRPPPRLVVCVVVTPK